MGAGGASTGGGGGVGPAGIKTDGTYGTKKDAKKASRRNEFRTFVKEGGMIGKVIRGVTGKTPYEINLERRQKFVKSKGLTGEEINLDPSYLGSKEGLAELRKQGYTTASDNMNTGGGNDNNDTPAPTILKKTAGGQTVQTKAPTEAELSQSAAADAEEYDLRKTKKKGRSMTTLTSSKGLTDDKLTLGKPSLLGA
tara:strand:- start:78 stop:665 length:588 start_codon:yes stop_codon:yes gene_type:complete